VRTRRALFLSGSFGKGHDTLAEACAEALDPFGVESTIVDCMPMLGRGLSGVGDRVFRTLLSWPPAYDAFHFSQLRAEGPLGRFADRAAVKVMMPNLRREVDARDPDLVVSVFATGAAGAAALKRERPDLMTVVFMTDSVAHRIWVHEGTDLHLVTSELAAASIRRYEPTASVSVVEAPVRRAFADPPSQAAARATLGVDPAARCVLVMSGGWGIGPVAEITRALAAQGYAVLAVAGDNEALAGRLREIAATSPRVVPFGYTDQVASLMAASDVVVTSSGDTCREARAVGRPLVLLDVVPGHGRENLLHEVEMGDAAMCSPSVRSVVGAVDWTLARGRRGPDPTPPDPTHPDPTGAEGPAGARWSDGFLAALRSMGAELVPVTSSS
jgi:UDP-N-acetylglucosamine:LPS N-acetylglucosamine transferase